MSRCPDCKGTGKYYGLVVVEDCQACRGTGKDPDSLPDGLPDWMDDYQDRLGEFDLGIDLGISVGDQTSLGMPDLGDKVYFISPSRRETVTVIIEIFSREVRVVDFFANEFLIKKNTLCYNLTKKRWEVQEIQP